MHRINTPHRAADGPSKVAAPRPKIIDRFARIARAAAHQLGHPLTFAAAIGVVVLWAATGPLFGWSDTWQLVINTGTTIVTFVMVFLIQNTQNRDNEAVQLKLDELIRTTAHARNRLLNLEECSEAEIEHLRREFQRLAEKRQAAQARLDEAMDRRHSEHQAGSTHHGPREQSRAGDSKCPRDR
ncbi:MAG TPA: low affinity iron permease family protein [Alphaproteobacteria bacterium]